MCDCAWRGGKPQDHSPITRWFGAAALACGCGFGDRWVVGTAPCLNLECDCNDLMEPGPWFDRMHGVGWEGGQGHKQERGRSRGICYMCGGLDCISWALGGPTLG